MKNIIFNKTENFVGRNTSDHACQIVCCDNDFGKGKGQKDKQRSTKHAYKTKYRLTRMPLKTGMNSGAPEG
jgi:hypothetical protein